MTLSPWMVKFHLEGSMSEELKAGHPPAGQLHNQDQTREYYNIITSTNMCLITLFNFSESWRNACGDKTQSGREG